LTRRAETGYGVSPHVGADSCQFPNGSQEKKGTNPDGSIPMFFTKEEKNV
jgi:hypothetical protein